MPFSLDKTGGPLCIWSEMTSEMRWRWSHLIFFFIRILKMPVIELQTSHGGLSCIDWKECTVSLFSKWTLWLCQCRRTDGSRWIKAAHIAYYVIFASWSERVWVAAYLRVMRSVFGLWLVCRNLPHFGTVAFQTKRWKAEKPPGVAGRTGCSGSPLFTCSATAVDVNWETRETRICVLYFVLCVLVDGTQHLCFLSYSSFFLLCCRCLENWDPATAFCFVFFFSEWTGNPTHSLSLPVTSFSSGMIVLWCTVHISNYLLVLAHILVGFIILCPASPMSSWYAASCKNFY